MTALRLAEACGEWDVDAMLESMTPEQWREWQAKDLIEPIGHRGTHDILALFAAMVASCLGCQGITEQSFAWWREPRQEKEASHDSAIMALQAIGAKRRG